MPSSQREVLEALRTSSGELARQVMAGANRSWSVGVFEPLMAAAEAVQRDLDRLASEGEGEGAGLDALAAFCDEHGFDLEVSNIQDDETEDGRWRTIEVRNGIYHLLWSTGDASPKSLTVAAANALRALRNPPSASGEAKRECSECGRNPGSTVCPANDPARFVPCDNYEPGASGEEPEGCPDGGKCHHGCVSGCFRVVHAGPLSGVYPRDIWPEDVRQAWSDLQHEEAAEKGAPDLAHALLNALDDEQAGPAPASPVTATGGGEPGVAWDLAAGGEALYIHFSESLSDDLSVALSDEGVSSDTLRACAEACIRAARGERDYRPFDTWPHLEGAAGAPPLNPAAPAAGQGEEREERMRRYAEAQERYQQDRQTFSAAPASATTDNEEAGDAR